MKIINKVVNIFVALYLLLSLSVNAHSDVNLDTSDNTSIQVPEKHFYNSGIDSASELKQFVDELKADIAANCRQQVAEKVRYPILINPNNNNQLEILTIKDFLLYYDKIINQKVKDAVANQNFNDIKGNSYGVMLGRGVVWIGSIKLHEKDDFKIKIIGINNQ
ncbi:hypothetical protein [uncultured Shewanella sp.]|uniref:hypothetical protein n=1 Tax=uncultured Shewanella sp. TaxID=173975 RepID=UPI00260A72F0|nr:hypothetical protein [uncultured Shewanella sp.]